MSDSFDEQDGGDAYDVAGESFSQDENDAVTASPDAFPRTRSEVKQVTQELLRYGLIEEQRKAEIFRRAVTLAGEVTAALEPLDFEMKLDEHRGIAYLIVAKNTDAADAAVDDGGAEWSHPLVRRQRLTLEQSLLIAILRQAFVMHEQESGVGGAPAKVALEDLMPLFLDYLEDSGSDAKNESRLASLLDQLKAHGIVSEIDKNNEVTIRPLIAHLANPESLAALLRVFQEAARDRNGSANGKETAE